MTHGAPGTAHTQFDRYEYGDDPSQYGELFRHTRGQSLGVAVVIHGGFWRARYDASLGRPLAESLIAEGWDVWNLEYRRVGNGGGHLHTLVDVSAGIDRLAGIDGLNLSTVVAIGHSAGGHLAMVAAERAHSKRWAASTVAVTAVIAQAAVLDLAAARRDRLGDGAVDDFMGSTEAEITADLNPVQHIPSAVPVWCVHGWQDDTVPISQSIDYVNRARTAGARANLLAVDGDHFSVVEPGCLAWDLTLQVLRSLSVHSSSN